MILVDANLLLYAYDRRSPHHKQAAEWLSEIISGPESIAFTWQVLLAFLRISTDTRLYTHPLSFEEAASVVTELITRKNVIIVEPSQRHWQLLQELIRTSAIRGANIMDANLAATAIENGATLFTADRDFSRFSNLRWKNPLRN